MKLVAIIYDALTSGKFIFNFCITYVSGLGVLKSFTNVISSVNDEFSHRIWQVFWLTVLSIVFAYGVFYFTRDLRRLVVFLWKYFFVKSPSKKEFGKGIDNANNNS